MLNAPVNAESESDFHYTRSDAMAGNPEAQFALAAYLAARPASTEFPEAMTWYLKAADQNHHLAQLNLGQMFAHGQGMPKNDSTALMWIQRSANGGDAGAQFNLGERYGAASLQDSEMDAVESRVESYKWFTLAAAQSYRNAVDRSDSATLRMTREEVCEGNRRVSGFVTT